MKKILLLLALLNIAGLSNSQNNYVPESVTANELKLNVYYGNNPIGYPCQIWYDTMRTAFITDTFEITGIKSGFINTTPTQILSFIGGKYVGYTNVSNIPLSSGQVTTALGFTPYNATNPNGYLSSITSNQVTTALGFTPVSQAGARTAISLTTTGTSGAATYNNSTGVLNIPNYATSSSLPFIELTKTTAQTIGINTLTTTTWDSESVKDNITHSNTTNNSRITLASNGNYEGGVTLWFTTWNSVTVSRLEVQLFKNGSFYKELYDFSMLSSDTPTISLPFTIANGTTSDYYEIKVLQNSGANRDISTTSFYWLKKI
jgi:hypothetical protein